MQIRLIFDGASIALGSIAIFAAAGSALSIWSTLRDKAKARGERRGGQANPSAPAASAAQPPGAAIRQSKKAKKSPSR